MATTTKAEVAATVEKASSINRTIECSEEKQNNADFSCKWQKLNREIIMIHHQVHAFQRPRASTHTVRM